jgi:hypothetical protein
MVSGKGIRMGMGVALRLAGMGGDACLHWFCGGGNPRHTASQGRKYETVSGYRSCIITPVMPCLLVERRKTNLEMGRQKITELDRTKAVRFPQPLHLRAGAGAQDGRRIPYREYSFKAKSCIIQ